MNKLRCYRASLFIITSLALVGIFEEGAMAKGLQVEIEGMEEIDTSVQKGHAEVRRINEAYKAEREARRRESAGSNYGQISCGYVSKDYGLYEYCETGSCDGFSSDYNLYRLCSKNDIDAMSGNYVVWRYLKDGKVSFKDYNVASKAEKQSSFSDRKRFVIYYLRGYILGKN